MKKIFPFLAVLLLTWTSVLAEQYTIIFNSNGGNSDSQAKTALTDIVLSSTNSCVSDVIVANKIYRARQDFGIKGGTTSIKGELLLRLDTTYAITSMTVYAAGVNGEGSGIIVCDSTITWDSQHNSEITPYTFSLSGTRDSISITAQKASNNRWYVKRIDFTADNPHPDRASLEATHNITIPSVNLAEVDVAEDVVSAEITGNKVIGTISLSLKKGTIFSLNKSTLPAEGGEVNISFSTSNKDTYTDTLIATAIGADKYQVYAYTPLKFSTYYYVPKEVPIDSSCMVFGAMPSDYYERAQHTQDSVLKSKLGEIIQCGIRYKYGSGRNKTWNGFFFTDRDTLSNQVLDMYSNNVRYFNPLDTTSSVLDFDIEHMLPKSWWGGTVNEAYCDLFHLVPADYSANRSKSNHAPGVPTDTTFWNGSFATGSGATYGLDKVFCPADEYKGDFARAYFYIVTCYGDNLTWDMSSESEAKGAMSNDRWQDFQPWLSELLMSWHRQDPVSQKELDRAVQVNKIQGNRNPFIDFPELAEYIWGTKQGQVVNFYQLEQSYGDPYDDNPIPTGTTSSTNKSNSVRKVIHNNQLIILRNGHSYSILGQIVQ